MQTDMHFTQTDKEQFIEFLNFIANRAVFPDWKTADSIKHFKMLSHMQVHILPKIEANILEVVQVKAQEPKAKK